MPGPWSTFSFTALLSLLAVIGVSSLMFWLLVRRATSHRQWVTFAEWGRRKGFRFARLEPDDPPPPPFDRLAAGPLPLVRFYLRSTDTAVMQLQPVTDPRHAGADSRRAADRPRDWNLLVRRIESTWPPTALRPAAQTSSAVDLFSLASFPTMLSPDRFMAFGTDSAAARALAKSPLAGLLPPDVGLLLHGQHLILDFSARPFDAIEFDRMLALADQLVAHLPALTPSAARGV